MQILEFSARIMQIIKNYRIPYESYKNLENHKRSGENHANHQNLKSPCENHENQESPRIHAIIIKIMKNI